MAAERDYTVVRYGTDSSGRGIWMTKWMILVFEAILRHPEVAPFAFKVTIVQGAFMVREGGGAVDSSGYHDQGGCIDIRTWNLTTLELNILVRIFRLFGFALWRRDESAQHGGMDPHAHGTLGSDSPLSPGAKVSWSSYVSGGDGLAGPGSDYEWRPFPLVTIPPADLLEEDYLMTNEGQAKLDQILRRLDNIDSDLATFRTAERERDKQAAKKAKEVAARQIAMLGGVVDVLTEVANSDDVATIKKRIAGLKAVVLEHLAQDPDVDGPESPGEATA